MLEIRNYNRYVIESNGQYVIVDYDDVEKAILNGFLGASFVIEFNNNEGHYLEICTIYTKDYRIDESYNEFSKRIIEKFNEYLYSKI